MVYLSGVGDMFDVSVLRASLGRDVCENTPPCLYACLLNIIWRMSVDVVLRWMLRAVFERKNIINASNPVRPRNQRFRSSVAGVVIAATKIKSRRTVN